MLPLVGNVRLSSSIYGLDASTLLTQALIAEGVQLCVTPPFEKLNTYDMSEQRLSAAKAVKFIQARTSVNEPGKYNLQVLGSNPHDGRIIINLKAQEPKGLEAAKQHLRDGEFDAAANTNMSTSVFEDANFIPAKGEYIACMVDYVETRDGGTKLGVVSISEIKAKSAGNASLGDEFANLLDEVEATKEVAPE